MPDIQVIANIIRFDGYDVAQIDQNLPATVRQRFEAALSFEEEREKAFQAGYDQGMQDADEY